MTVVRGIIREVGQSRTTRVSAHRWYGSTTIVIQNEETRQTYSVRISDNVLQKCRFLPRVGIPVIVHGYVEEAEFGLSDFVVSRVTSIKREGAGIKKVHQFDED
ncbi:MAG: hypothetical protein ACFE7R_10870 [Candidatus Hodarchaeota archaeon]